MKTLIYVVVGIIAVMSFVKCLAVGIERQEMAECLKWREQSMMYRRFYLTASERKQCAHYSIDIVER